MSSFQIWTNFFENSDRIAGSLTHGCGCHWCPTTFWQRLCAYYWVDQLSCQTLGQRNDTVKKSKWLYVDWWRYEIDFEDQVSFFRTTHHPGKFGRTWNQLVGIAYNIWLQVWTQTASERRIVVWQKSVMAFGACDHECTAISRWRARKLRTPNSLQTGKVVSSLP